MDVCNLDLCYSLHIGISDLLPVLKLTLYAIVVVNLIFVNIINNYFRTGPLYNSKNLSWLKHISIQ